MIQPCRVLFFSVTSSSRCSIFSSFEKSSAAAVSRSCVISWEFQKVSGCPINAVHHLAKMAKREISLTLEQQQLDWLQSMATKYNLPTADKALRIIVLYAKQVNDSAAPLFKELSSKSQAEKSPVTEMHTIDEVHDTFLEEFKGSYNLSSKDQAVHVILEYCMSHADEKTIFETVNLGNNEYPGAFLR
ncbi:hypothetical protein R1flu_006997 [Riccia fluitans]|uniref:Uncharacterized protein n=1 Tax=Riccia fluitans TaxID=41844 RepID=A0ABD1YXT1_9MARC